MLAPLLGLFYFYIGATPLFYVPTVAGLLMIPGIILLRKTKNMMLVGNYAIFILWGTISVLAWNTGSITYEGVIRPTWILSAGLILLAIFLNGYMSGTIWTTLVFVETGIVVYLFRNGYQFPNLIPPEISTTYSMGTYLICLLAILSFAFLFEKEKSEALIREQEKSLALRESKRYMDDILERSPLPTFILDRSHRVLQWNSACREMTDVPAENILGKEVWDGFRVDEQGSIADIILEAPDLIEKRYGDFIVSKTESGWFELEMPLPKLRGGVWTYITAAPILDNENRVRGAIQTIQEIKEHKPETGFLGQAAASSSDPIFKIDSQGKINFWNEACEKKFGYTASQMVGNTPLTLVAKRYRSPFRETIGMAFKGESFSSKEWRYMSGKGKSVYVLARVYPLQAPDGRGKECVVVNTDITNLRLELKKLQLYAAESNERFKNLSEEYGLLKKNIATFIRKKNDQA